MKLSKRIVCILLSLLLLTTTGILTAAAENAAACPTVYVYGRGASGRQRRSEL